MKCLKSILLGVFFASSAFAQAPSPTQIGTLKTTNPYPVSILYNNVWYPMGSVNTTLNIFTLPVGNVVNGTTPLLTATNTFTNLQTYSSGIAIGGATALVSIKNPSTISAYNFNLPDSAGAANAPLLSGGGSTNPMSWGTRSGSTTAFATVSGSLTGGNCVSIDSSGNLVDAGGPCSTGGGGGTVTSGQTGELAFYASNGTTVTGNTNANMAAGKLTLGIAGSSQGSLALSGTTSGTATLAVPAVAGSGTMTLPVATDTIVGKATTDTLTNKTIDTLGPNTIRINGTSLTSVTGTGSVVLSTSPTLITPILGTPTSATLTNATGLPISTGLTGAGTGVITALGVAANAANGFPTLGTGGLLAVTKGGTGLGVGVSGGIPYFNTTTTMASSALLTQYGIVYGGGPAGAPVSTAAGTTNYLLTGAGASAPPVFSSLSTVLDTNFATPPATTVAQGSLIYRDAVNWAVLGPSATAGQILQSGGAAANPSFATLSSLLDTSFSNTQGSILYRGAAGWAALGPGTSGQFLQTAGAAANPTWATATGSSYGPEYDAVGGCGIDNTGATDVTTALNSCLTTNTAVMLRSGTYQVSGCVNVPSNGRLIGTGMATTIITSTSASANVICPANNGTRITLENFRVTKSVTATGGAGVYVPKINQSFFKNIVVDNNFYGFNLSETDFSICEYCIAQNNYSHGFYLPGKSGAFSALQWIFIGTLSQINDGWGYYVTGASANTIIGNMWSDPTSFGNKLGGFSFTISSGANINDIAIYNGVASGDCGDEIYLNLGTGGYNNSFVGGLFEFSGTIPCGRAQASPATNTGFGFALVSFKNITITNASIWGNSYTGISATLASSGTVTLNGNIITDNGAYKSSTEKAGVFLSPFSGLVTGVISGNDFVSSTSATTQTYGIVIGSTAQATINGNNANACFLVGATKPTGTASAFNFGTNCP